MLSVQIHKSERCVGLELRHPDGRSMAIHPFWLRERCSDSSNLDERTGQRLYNPNALTSQLEIIEVQQISADAWHVSFNDGAKAHFHARSILSEMDHEPDLGLPQRIPWDAQLGPINALNWTSAYAPDHSLEQIEHFLKYGFVILCDVPTKPGTILDVARRFGYPRETNFGLLFEVKSIPEANDLAYTGLSLDAHTDNPYRDPVPGVQLLHCLVNDSTGGLSTLVDGYAVVEKIRAIDPGAYEILSKTPVRFVFRDIDGHYTDYAPIIEHDHSGEFSGIRFSPRLDFVPLLAPQELDRFYAARRLLDRTLRSSEFEIKFLLSPGELVMFDNRRLLHGRTAFDPRSGLRHLQGCYIDRDAIESQYRILSRKLRTGACK